MLQSFAPWKSAFNIKLESLTLSNFTEEEVATLYRQHTAETGQVFTDEALRRAFELTQGQPWLVNALARQAVEFIETDRRKPITPAIIDQAKERIIERQETHLDSLVDRLREPRIRNIIEPILAGKSLADLPADDLRFVLDLGLVKRSNGGGVAPANPIYREVIPTMLAFVTRATLPQIAPIWLNPDGTRNPAKLLDAFLKFWRQHGQPLLKSVHYHEIAPHIVLMYCEGLRAPGFGDRRLGQIEAGIAGYYSVEVAREPLGSDLSPFKHPMK